METVLVKILAVVLALSQVSTRPDQVQTRFDRVADQAQVLALLRDGCTHMRKVFEVEDLALDDLVDTALADPKAMTSDIKAFHGINFADLGTTYRQLCRNENPDPSPIDLAAVIDFYDKAAADLPDHARLKGLRLASPSQVLDGKGAFFAEIYEPGHRRIPVRLDEIPPIVQRAFVAAEDQRFFEHHGIDERGLVRAFVVNMMQPGRPQGGSTITQQVVKNLLVGDDVTYERKVREIIVTTRLEQTLTKQEILELYLNSIYFGRNSWGVELAARNWFGKSVKDVSLAEAAMLAGLVKGPNYFSPERAPDRARERLGYVLGRMQEDGVVTAAEARQAQALPALVAAQRPRNEVAQSFFDYLGREVKTLPGVEPLANATYTIRSTIYPEMQAATEAALQEGLAEYEMKSGRVDFQGPEANLAEAIAQLAAARGGAPAATLAPDWQQALAAVHLPLHDVHWTPAVVIDRPGPKRNSAFKVGLADGRVLPLHSASATALKKLQLYDVVYVKAADAKGRTAARADLRVRPVVQGAALVLENRTGRVLAMAGGFSYSLSQLNRTSQTRRQPGSAIKPITYLAALRAGLQPNTLVRDEPITLPPINGSTRERDYYTPKNYDGGAMGVLTLRRALENSRNLATVGLLDGGIESTASASLDRVCELAQEAQLYAECQHYYPIVLGAQPVRLIDLAAFYAAIANEGARPTPHAIASVEQDGRVVWRDDTRAPVWLGSADRVAFYQLKSMLQGVVLRGTANALRDLGAFLAGKTGTSEDENDAWFVGFTNDVTVAVWVGYDNANGRRTLGSGATGGHTAVPIFRPIIEASWKYVAKQAQLAPPSAEARRQLVMLPIDLASGTRVERGQPQGYASSQGYGYGSQGYGSQGYAPQGVTITEAFRTNGRGQMEDTQYRIVSELDAGTRIEGDQYGEQQYPDGYRTWYSDRQTSNPDGYSGYRYYGGPQGGAYRVAPPSPYQQPQQQQPQYGRGLFGSWSSQPPPQPQQPQRRIDPDYFWHNRIN